MTSLIEVAKPIGPGEDIPSIVAFSKEKAYCWSLMPSMLERIGKFAEKYCEDTMPALLVSHVMKDFTNIQPGFFILGAVQDYELTGHLLACISVPPWSQQRRCLILQYELDESMSIDLLRAALDLVIDWSKTQYCGEIICEVKTDHRRRAGKMFYGFETDMIQLRKAL